MDDTVPMHSKHSASKGPACLKGGLVIGQGGRATTFQTNFYITILAVYFHFWLSWE